MFLGIKRFCPRVAGMQGMLKKVQVTAGERSPDTGLLGSADVLVL